MAAPVSPYIFYPDAGQTNGWDLRHVISWDVIPGTAGETDKVHVQFSGIGSNDARPVFERAAFEAAIGAISP